MHTENNFYGKAKNPVDSLPTQGKRTLMMDREVTVTIQLYSI